MLFDVLKAYFAIQIAKLLFPKYLCAGLAAVGGLIIYKHRENFVKAKKGTEMRLREFPEKCEEFR